jgi:membrane protein YqaA with SNARE-associated domain
MALVDNSIIPTPGSVDLLTVYFAARTRELWYYYAFVSTLGSVIGGYITYRLGRKGGKAALESKVSRSRLKKFYKKFESGGFWSIFIPGLLPPPFPMSPFLVAAGAFNYPRNKFLGALAASRAIRYSLIAYLASIYGRHIMRFVNQYYKPIMWASVLFFVGCALAALFMYLKHRSQSSRPRAGGFTGSSSPEVNPRVA